MNLDFTDQELDFIFKLLVSQRMDVVEPLVNKIRQQVALHQSSLMAVMPLPNGSAQPPEVTQ